MDIQKKDFAQTLARGLACLEALADAAKPMSGSQVAAAMRVSRPAARRILLTLQHLGYVREELGRYVPTPKVLSLGRGLVSKGSLWDTVAPEVVDLANRLNEPCSISVLDGMDIVFVCRDSTRRMFTSRLGVGDRLPAHCSASGKMLLALLPEPDLNSRLQGVTLTRQGPASITNARALKAALRDIREADFALAVDEMEEGTVSIAVPLRDRNGRPVAAMSIASHRSRYSPTELRKSLLPQLRAAADKVEAIIRDFQVRNGAAL
jgi:IclR family transcriptional regulator, pca regulon regulatory protein